MLKSHKQCLALLCLAFFTPSRPFALSFLSLLTACLLFCPTKRGKARENACNMKRQWQSRTDREKSWKGGEKERGRNGVQDKKPACVEESNEPRNLADATAASTSNRATLLRLPPYPLWIPLQEAWNKTVIKSTRGWRCGRQRKSKSWLEPAPLTIGLSSARVEAHPLPGLHCVEVEEKE